ncbi:hypothetical protein BH09BAC1_BH09BAC1_20560 [soil metagenome]
MKKILKILLVNLLILLALFFCLEIALRIKGDTYTWTEKGQNIYVDPWDAMENSEIRSRPFGKHTEHYSEFIYTIDVNEIGVRDITHEIQKPSNTLRILGLGDSFMEGMGSDFDSTIMSLLGTKLNNKINSISIEPLSGGVAGSDIFRSFNLFKSKFLLYNPDFVIVLLNNTDINDWLVHGDEEGFRPPISPPSNLKKVLFKYSHLYRSITINLLGYTWLQQSPKEQIECWKWFKKDFELIMMKYLQLIGDKKKLLIVFHPLLHEFNENNYYYSFSELEAILANLQIQSLNSRSLTKDLLVFGD